MKENKVPTYSTHSIDGHLDGPIRNYIVEQFGSRSLEHYNKSMTIESLGRKKKSDRPIINYLK